MIRPVPDIAVSFVKGAEGCKLTSYRDVGGVMTIGVGHCGPEVVPGLTITQSVADTYLREDLEIAAKRLSRVVDGVVLAELSDHQYAALISFVFNAGAPSEADLWAVLNARKFELVPHELRRWIYAKRKVVPGLVNRRAAEVALWSTPDDHSPDVGKMVANDDLPPIPPPVAPAKPVSLFGKIRSLFA